MVRCVVSLLLVPCVLLSQLAPLALAHAHQGNEPAGHDARPHTHVSVPQPACDHGHSHHGHSHYHGDDSIEPSPAPSVLQATTESEHDTDAVYIATGDLVSDSRVTALESWTLLLALSVSPTAALSFREEPSRVGSNFSHPPPPRGACPIYVRHLAMLI